MKPRDLTILICGFGPPETDYRVQLFHDAVSAAAPEARLIFTHNRDDFNQALPNAHIVVGGVPRELLAEAKSLRWIVGLGAGLEWSLYPELLNSDIIVTSSSGVHAIQMSEHILAMMFMFARRLHLHMRKQVELVWDSQVAVGRVFELENQTLGVVGMGSVGEALAVKGLGLGMRVIAVRYRRELGGPPGAKVRGPEGLPKLLRAADHVGLCLPLTDETRGLIGEPELRQMKPTAYIYNVGRGTAINEADLVCALQEGWIAGAGLDVFETEPLPAQSPLWDMENVIITPHVSGHNPFYFERCAEIFGENLRRFMAGEELLNVRDKIRQY